MRQLYSFLKSHQQATVHICLTELNTLDALMQQRVRLPLEARAHITALICLTEGLRLFDISEGFWAT